MTWHQGETKSYVKLVKFARAWMLLGLMSLLGLAVSPLALADDAQPCDNATIAAVAHWAGIKGKLVSWNEHDGLIAAAACKAMPNSPDTTIAAVAFDTNHEGPNPNPGEGHKEQIIALVEAGKVVAANRSTIEEDAGTAVGSYRVDTAPYLLSKDVRAFGVVFHSDARGASCPDANVENELTLWIREGDRLRAVFGANLDGWIDIDQTSCMIDATSGRTETAHMTVAMEKTASHGFADIAITAHVTRSQWKDHQEAAPVKRTSRKVLKYDGRSYGVDMFRNFWYPSDCPKDSICAP